MEEQLLNRIEETHGKAYAQALKFTMASEGLFANHSDDRGGMTYKGITTVWAGRWEGWKIIDKYIESFPELKQPFRKAPTSLGRFNDILNGDIKLNLLVYDFYYEKYYKKCGADRVANISPKLSIILFDISVLQGVRRAVKTLQRLLNRYYNCSLVVDGLFGKNTLKALSDTYEKDMINLLILEYVDNLVEASKVGKNHVFLKGWMNRTQNLTNYLRLLK